VILEGTTRTDVVKWKVADVGERTLYIEARILTFVGEDGVVGGLIVSPLAIVVREREQEYAISLAESDLGSFGAQLLETML
jgi:hypothetical protein